MSLQIDPAFIYISKREKYASYWNCLLFASIILFTDTLFYFYIFYLSFYLVGFNSPIYFTINFWAFSKYSLLYKSEKKISHYNVFKTRLLKKCKYLCYYDFLYSSFFHMSKGSIHFMRSQHCQNLNLYYVSLGINY